MAKILSGEMINLTIDLFKAYYQARQNKRNTCNQLKFEYRFESNLLALSKEIAERVYKPRPEVAFIISKPVKREIFAADFRDRIVHHLLFGYLNPIMEKYFINDCYSCRKGKGTHYGIKRIDHYIRACSLNYKRDCYILKLDVQGYFMSINKEKLFEFIQNILAKEKVKNGGFPFEENDVMYLLRKVIFNNPVKNCRIKGNLEDWNGLPKTKSLFYTKEGCGLPIGNLTSQLFGNIYLSQFDHFVKRHLKIKYYGRYVDDLVLIHNNKEYLQSLISIIREYLKNELMLQLHPDKIYLQHYSKGARFLGVIIKPYRIYVSKRIKGNFHQLLTSYISIIQNQHRHTREQQKVILSSINSYLGIFSHYKTYQLRKKTLKVFITSYFANLFAVDKNYYKIKKVKDLSFLNY